MSLLTVNGNAVLAFADKEAWFRLTDGDSRIVIDPEALFTVDPEDWSEAESESLLSVYIPTTFGIDIQFRAPKHLFREVHVHS
jgi:hypothetical protein